MLGGGMPGYVAGGIQDYLNTNNINQDIMGGMYDRQMAPVSQEEAAMTMGSLAPQRPMGPSIGGMPGSFSENMSDEQMSKLPGGSASQGPDGSGGIGLMGTLGIINMGAGLGGQIYSMLTRKKERRPTHAVPGPSGNPLR